LREKNKKKLKKICFLKKMAKKFFLKFKKNCEKMEKNFVEKFENKKIN